MQLSKISNCVMKMTAVIKISMKLRNAAIHTLSMHIYYFKCIFMQFRCIPWDIHNSKHLSPGKHVMISFSLPTPSFSSHVISIIIVVHKIQYNSPLLWLGDHSYNIMWPQTQWIWLKGISIVHIPGGHMVQIYYVHCPHKMNTIHRSRPEACMGRVPSLRKIPPVCILGRGLLAYCYNSYSWCSIIVQVWAGHNH